MNTNCRTLTSSLFSKSARGRSNLGISLLQGGDLEPRVSAHNLLQTLPTKMRFNFLKEFLPMQVISLCWSLKH